ncbi:MAG: DinB family protein [Crocinitomicaceae bacterium]|nr:DinB family protein [Crocinitomicaceae bacterium]
MNSQLEIFTQGRQNILKLTEELSLDQLNKIPDGFTGNIIWHMGHLVSTQQGLLYRLSGLEMNLEASFIDKYKKGAVPQSPADQAELEYIKKELIAQTDKLKSDFAQQKFKNYTTYPTSFGYTMNTFDEALNFVLIHEGMHIGYIMAMRRLVK